MTSQEQVVAALRRSVRENLRLRQENEQLTKAAREPIAIVGMSCRYPGGCGRRRTCGTWSREGRDAISEFPDDRGWDLERLYDPDPDRPGRTYTRHGGFLHDATEFDAAFFGISPREALAMDPAAAAAAGDRRGRRFERAGIDPPSLRGSRTGVFVGCSATTT